MSARHRSPILAEGMGFSVEGGLLVSVLGIVYGCRAAAKLPLGKRALGNRVAAVLSRRVAGERFFWRFGAGVGGCFRCGLVGRRRRRVFGAGRAEKFRRHWRAYAAADRG